LAIQGDPSLPRAGCIRGAVAGLAWRG